MFQTVCNSIELKIIHLIGKRSASNPFLPRYRNLPKIDEKFTKPEHNFKENLYFYRRNKSSLKI